MNNFSLSQADSIGDAISTKASTDNSHYIGGGTNLVDLMKYGIENPDHLIDINRIEMNEITDLGDGGLRIGASVTNADTAYHDIVKTRYPILSKAILSGASAQLRNAATNGGNLLQRTRCYYFYDTSMACNKRSPGSGCAALNGFNRMHAILGANKNCIAVHPSDMCVALSALDAKVNVRGPSGNRTINFLDFHKLPEDNPEKDSNLKPHEIVISIDLPKEGFSENFSYLKVRERPSYAFALVSAAVGLQLKDNKLSDIRIALGGVAHKPWRDPDIEQEFQDSESNIKTFKQIAEKMLENAHGYGHNDFKVTLAKNTIVRALNESTKKLR